jgi:hypothetical protein
MAKYLVVHPVGKELTVEAATPFAKAVKANHTVDAYWIGSRYAREEGKLYCEFDAKEVLTKAAEVAGELPTEGIYKIELMVNSEDFR